MKKKHLMLLVAETVAIVCLLIYAGLKYFEEKNDISWEDFLEQDAGRQHNNTLFIEWVESNMPIMEMYATEIDTAVQSGNHSAILYWADLGNQYTNELREAAYDLNLTPSCLPIQINYSWYLLEINWSAHCLILGIEATLEDNLDRAEFYLNWSRDSYDRSVEYLENVKYLIFVFNMAMEDI